MKSKTIDLSDFAHDPVKFARAFMRHANGQPLDPHPGQVELLHNIKPLTICCCGRQWGKSVAMAIYCTWFAVTHSNRQVYVISPTLDQARIIFNDVALQFREGPLASLLVGKIKEYPFPYIKLANGTEIHGRGANSPQFLRGKKCHLAIVDEAAFCKDQTLTDVIEPFLTVTGKEKDSAIIQISTPFGLGAFKDYYDAASSGEDNTMTSFHFTSLDNPHADRRFLERVKNRVGEESMTWRTEYLAQFVDDDLAVFPASLIKWAYENYPYYDEKQQPLFPVPPAPGHRYAQGVDLANVRDWFVAAVADVSDPMRVTLVQMTRLQKRGYKFYKEIIRNQYATYNQAETLIDATSLGESVAEDLSDISVEGYKFTNQSKYEIVNELSRMFAEHRFVFPFDREIISELRNFERVYTASKNVRMEARKGHDDIVMSLALIAHLALIPRTLGTFQAVDLVFNDQPKHVPGFDPFKELFAFET
jgi:phage FluMu gp28-like protein